MRILLSNDDGYFAPGLSILADTLSALSVVRVLAIPGRASCSAIIARKSGRSAAW